MVPDGVRVTVLGGSAPGECDAGCGTDWSAAESISLASERIRERFGREINIEYVDAADRANPVAKEWREKIREKDLSLPLLLLNNRLRISGQFDVRQLLDVIEIELEVGQ